MQRPSKYAEAFSGAKVRVNVETANSYSNLMAVTRNQREGPFPSKIFLPGKQCGMCLYLWKKDTRDAVIVESMAVITKTLHLSTILPAQYNLNHF